MGTGRIGRITAPPEVKRAKNGDTNVLMLTVRFSDGGTASAQWMPGAGDDTSPQENDIVAVERYGGVLVVTASKSPGDPALKSGEREFYSRTRAGERAARLILKTDGNAELSSGTPAGKTGDVVLGSDGSAIASLAAGQPAALHGLKPAGTQYIGNALAGQDVFTVMNTFLTQVITALTTAVSGSPPPTLDPGALAAFSAILPAAVALQTQWALIFDAVPPVLPTEAP